MTDGVITYDVEIIGHQSPFAWICYRIGLDGVEYNIGEGQSYGDTFDARNEALEIAQNDIWERVHRNTKMRLTMLEVDPLPSDLERHARDKNVVNYGLKGNGKDQWQRLRH